MRNRSEIRWMAHFTQIITFPIDRLMRVLPESRHGSEEINTCEQRNITCARCPELSHML